MHWLSPSSQPPRTVVVSLLSRSSPSLAVHPYGTPRSRLSRGRPGTTCPHLARLDQRTSHGQTTSSYGRGDTARYGSARLRRTGLRGLATRRGERVRFDHSGLGCDSIRTRRQARQTLHGACPARPRQFHSDDARGRWAFFGRRWTRDRCRCSDWTSSAAATTPARSHAQCRTAHDSHYGTGQRSETGHVYHLSRSDAVGHVDPHAAERVRSDGGGDFERDARRWCGRSFRNGRSQYTRCAGETATDYDQLCRFREPRRFARRRRGRRPPRQQQRDAARGPGETWSEFNAGRAIGAGKSRGDDAGCTAETRILGRRQELPRRTAAGQPRPGSTGQDDQTSRIVRSEVSLFRKVWSAVR